jgi:hypothetical protein
VHIEPPSTARWPETGFRRGKSIADSVRARPGSRQFKDTAALHGESTTKLKVCFPAGRQCLQSRHRLEWLAIKHKRLAPRASTADPPDLAMERHAVFADRPLDEFLAFVRLVVLAVNLALPYRASRSRSRHA